MLANFMKIIMALSAISLFAMTSFAQTSYENDNALKGLKRTNIYFDVTLKDDATLVFRMELIDRTIQQLVAAGADVTAVIGFRGGASRFITKDNHYVLEEEIANKKQIQDWVKRFAAKDITIEQCAIAAGILDIPSEDFLAEVEIVANGYVSLIGYQSQGYAVVAID